MKTRLYLIQHGEAEAKGADPERHLTEKGIFDAEKMAAFLKPLDLRVDTVWHSGKARAIETIEIIKQALTAAQGIIQHEGLAWDDPVGPIKEAIEQSAQNLMIVGHMPFLGKLASALTSDSDANNVVAFRNGGVVCLERGEDAKWSVLWVVIPELLY